MSSISGALDHSISSSRSMNPRRPVHAFGWLLQSSHAISLPVSHRTRTSCGPGAQAFTPTTYRSGYELGQPLCMQKTSLPCHPASHRKAPRAIAKNQTDWRLLDHRCIPNQVLKSWQQGVLALDQEQSHGGARLLHTHCICT